MFGNNKYLVTFIIIIVLVLFSFLVYKIIKFNEIIKDINVEKASLEKTIASRDFTIKQLKTNNRQTKNQDDDGDYCKGKAPIEVFDNKPSEMNPRQTKPTTNNNAMSKKETNPDAKLTASAKGLYSEMETPIIDAKSKVIINSMAAFAKNASKKCSPVLNLSDDNIASISDGIMSEHTDSTASMIDNIIGNTNLNDIREDGDKTALSDTMYIVKDAIAEEGGEEEEEEEEEEGDGNEEYEYYDEDGNLIENDGNEYEYEYYEEEEEEEEDEQDEEDGEDQDGKVDDKDDDANEIEVVIEDNDSEEEDEEEIFVNEEFESEEEEEDEETKRKQMEAMSYSDIKGIAKNLKIRLSEAGKILSKSSLIEKILIV